MEKKSPASASYGYVTPSLRRLDGKVAIITGGASGIGASTVKVFWEQGAKVVIGDIQDQLGQAICNKLGTEHVSYIHCDVAKEDEIIRLIDTTVEKYGRVDIMYNNAGIIGTNSKTILDAERSDFDRVIGVNLVGAFLGAKHAARVMVPKRKGCILFTSSACASIAGLGESYSYAASKHGVVGLMKNLAAELGQYGIRANCVSPYAVRTNIAENKGVSVAASFTPETEMVLSEAGNLKGEVLKAEDIAKAALYLASDEAHYVSGLDLVMDGGFSIVNPSIKMAFN